VVVSLIMVVLGGVGRYWGYLMSVNTTWDANLSIAAIIIGLWVFAMGAVF